MREESREVDDLCEAMASRAPDIAGTIEPLHLERIARSVYVERRAVDEEAVVAGVLRMEMVADVLGEYEPQTVGDPVEIARRKAEESGTKKSPDLPTDMMADAMVTTSAILQSFKADIAEYREWFFGSQKAPFRGDRAAAEWIEGQARQRKKEFTERDFQEWFGIRDEMDDALKRLAKATGRRKRLGLEDVVVRYFRPKSAGAEICTAEVPPGDLTPLSELEHLIWRITEETNFNDYEIARFVLTGKLPALHRWDLVVFGDPATELMTLEVKFRTQNVCWNDMVDIYSTLQLIRGGKANLIDQKDKAVWEAVQRLGEDGVPPTEGKTKFWEAVLRDVQRRYGFTWSRWHTPRKRWTNLIKNNPWLIRLILGDDADSETVGDSA